MNIAKSGFSMEQSVEQKNLAGAGEPWSFEASIEQKNLAGAGEPWSGENLN